MPFIPHTEEEVREMLSAIGADSIEDLFDEIPQNLRCSELSGIPEAMTEMDIGRLMTARAEEDGRPLSFIGAGAYAHHIPAAVWQITTRGEFYSAYTPYQAEASQGTLQLIYEYQSMITGLTGMDVANASLYDGASALGEAALMAVRANRKSKARRILVPRTLNPAYRRTAHSIIKDQGIELVEVDFDAKQGHTPIEALADFADDDFTALVIPQPNFFGCLEDVDQLTDWAHERNQLVIAVVNPTAMALLKAPGQWGESGADIVIGEGQPLGVPLSSGGPYFGFMCTKKPLVRQMPGRIVGRTVDLDGKDGFALTLQAREQHIRRSKATSNICTNQGLMVTAATIYMSLLGATGLKRVAQASHHNTRKLVERLSSEQGVGQRFSRPFFHECVIDIDALPADELLRSLAAHNVLGGYALAKDYPEMANSILVCSTEVHNDDDIAQYGDKLQRILEVRSSAGCPSQPKL